MGVGFSRKKSPENEAGIFTICHLAQIFACCRKGNAMKTSPNTSKASDFAAIHHKYGFSERIEVV